MMPVGGGYSLDNKQQQTSKTGSGNVIFNGPSGGAASDIGRWIAFANGGAEANGGESFFGETRYNGLTRGQPLASYMPWILGGGVVLLLGAVFLMRKG